MKLIALGTGNGGALKCYNTCFCIENNGKYFLTDGGGGNQILSQLKKVNIEINDIHDVFISHNHIDHIMGILWIMRAIYIDIRDNKYSGECNIYGSKESIKAVQKMRKIVFGKVDYDVTKGINFVKIKNNDELKICDMNVNFFDIQAVKDKQFGFTVNDNFLAFTGDEPLRKQLFPNFESFEWLLHEAFCLDSDKELYKPYDKGHCTVKDTAETAEKLNSKNLIIWHTKDNKQKETYINEAKQYFKGNTFVPNDLEVIDL